MAPLGSAMSVSLEMIANFPGEREGPLLEEDGAFANICQRGLALVVDARVPAETFLQVRQGGAVS
jgi:hypothetical protein